MLTLVDSPMMKVEPTRRPRRKILPSISPAPWRLRTVSAGRNGDTCRPGVHSLVGRHILDRDRDALGRDPLRLFPLIGER